MKNARECPECFGDSTTINSRNDEIGRYRIRECKECGCRWKTYEIHEDDLKELLKDQEELRKMVLQVKKINKFLKIINQIKSL